MIFLAFDKRVINDYIPIFEGPKHALSKAVQSYLSESLSNIRNMFFMV